jgi:hypothetical protein
MVPTGAAQLLVVAAFIMPGFVFQPYAFDFVVSLLTRGINLVELLRALGVSLAFDIVHFAALGR